MANTINILKPSVCFEVQKVIGISTNDGNCKTYQVQWAPSWISGFHLVGCEDLIEQFEHEQTEEHIKIEEIDANHSQDIIGLPNKKNNGKVVLQDDNLHEDSVPKQQIKDNQDNIVITNSSPSQSRIHHQSDISLKVSSLNSIIENITGNNNAQCVSRNTVHPDFQGLKTNTCNVNNDSSPQSNVQVDSKRQEAGDTSNDSVEPMVIVGEASDCGHSESSQVKAVQYFSGGNRDMAMPNNSFGSIMINTTSKNETDVNRNVDLLTVVGESSRSCKNQHGKILLERNSKERKPFVCDVCNKVFSNDLALKKHSKMHKGIRQRATSFKSFTAKAKLQKHELVHSADSEFSCSFCEEKFTDINTLLVHIQVHKTVKGNPLECPYCPKRFVSKANVRVHTRVHTGECPFTCSVCQRRFNVNSSLQRHLKTHVKERIQ